MDGMVRVAVDALYLLALINPISKVAVLSGFASGEERHELRRVALKCSIAATVILLGVMVVGDFVLRRVFHVEMYALRLTGGVVLFWVGFQALRRGLFFESGTSDRFKELALVPLACPMIAGPATIAACMTLRMQQGLPGPAVSLLLAVVANHLIMQASWTLSTILSRFNVMGALIRITGLLVMAMGANMALDGLAAWLRMAFRLAAP